METRETPKTPASLLYAMANKRPQLQQGGRTHTQCYPLISTHVLWHIHSCAQTLEHTHKEKNFLLLASQQKLGFS